MGITSAAEVLGYPQAYLSTPRSRPGPSGIHAGRRPAGIPMGLPEGYLCGPALMSSFRRRVLFYSATKKNVPMLNKTQ